MLPRAEFRAYHEATLLPILRTFEKAKSDARAVVRKRILWTALIGAAATFATISAVAGRGPVKPNPLIAAILIVPPLLTGIVIVALLLWRERHWVKRYAELAAQESAQAVIPAVKHLLPSFSHRQTPHVDWNRFRACRLLDLDALGWKTIAAHDQFSGRFGDLAVEFVGLQWDEERTEYNDTGGMSTFTGTRYALFCIAGAKTRRRGTTVLTRDMLEGVVGKHVAQLLDQGPANLLQGVVGVALKAARNPKDVAGVTEAIATLRPAEDRRSEGHAPLSVVRLEHDAFERRFRVQSTDAAEAAQLLTRDVMDRLVKIQPAWAVSLTGDHVILGLGKADNAWRIPSQASSTDFATYERLYDELSQAEELAGLLA